MNIVKCTYVTDSDVGKFESEAFVNLETGEVFNIKACDDPEQENINQVLSEYITFEFHGLQFESIIYDVEEFLIKVPQEVKKIILMNEMNDSLSSENTGKTRPKI